MQIIVSDTTSPSFNLASEQFLLTERLCDVLFLYINDPCVVLGRNQNLYAEVNIPYCTTNSIQIVRRLSGGGTVYHDNGNINFCFLSHKANNPLDYNPLNLITDALAHLHIPATVGTRKDLYLCDKKITGTAIHCRGSQSLFHGTLLFDTDLNQLNRSLTSPYLTESKAVKSTRSNVTNIKKEVTSLKDHSPKDFLQLLADYFEKQFHTQATQLMTSEKDVIEAIQRERYEDWEWNWGQNPKCTLLYPYNAKELLCLIVEKGVVIEITTDCSAAIKTELLNRKVNELL